MATMPQPAYEYRRNRQRYWLKRFDPDASFVVLRPFTANGIDLQVGETFDKSSVPERTLRLLYESRKLEQVSNGAAKTVSSDPTELPELSLLHTGRGRWVVVDVAGFRHCDPTTKAGATAEMNRILSDAGAAFRASRAAELGR